MMDLDDDKIEQTVQRQQGSRKGGSSFIMDFNREVDRWVVMVHVMDAKSRLQQALRCHQLKRIIVYLLLFALILFVGVLSMAWTMRDAGFDAVSAQLSHSECTATACHHAFV